MGNPLTATEEALIIKEWKTGKWPNYAALAKRVGRSDKTVRRCVLEAGLMPAQTRELKTQKPCGCKREGCIIERREDEPWHRFRDRRYRTAECRPSQSENQALFHALDYPKGGEAFIKRLEVVHGRWKGRPRENV